MACVNWFAVSWTSLIFQKRFPDADAVYEDEIRSPHRALGHT